MNNMGNVDNWSIDNIEWIKEKLNSGIFDRKIVYIRKELTHEIAKIIIKETELKYKNDSVNIFEMKHIEEVYINLNKEELLDMMNKAKKLNLDIDKIINRYRFF